MNKNDIETRIFLLGNIQMHIRREIGTKEAELKALKDELKETEKAMFTLRSTKEYEELYSK